MNANLEPVAFAADNSSPNGTSATDASVSETPQERQRRIYRAEGGPLMGWLEDEARARGHDQKTTCFHLGVTSGYLNQLRSGLRSTANIVQATCDSFAHYLGVPPIVVKVVSGQIRSSDFATRAQSEESLLMRAMLHIERDPAIGPMLRSRLRTLPVEAKRVVALMYGEVSGTDVLGTAKVPDMVHWLARAVDRHNDSALEAMQCDEE